VWDQELRPCVFERHKYIEGAVILRRKMGLETGSGTGGGAFESSHGVGAAVNDHQRMLSGLGMACRTLCSVSVHSSKCSDDVLPG
jgi:hypothetical protein